MRSCKSGSGVPPATAAGFPPNVPRTLSPPRGSFCRALHCRRQAKGFPSSILARTKSLSVSSGLRVLGSMGLGLLCLIGSFRGLRPTGTLSVAVIFCQAARFTSLYRLSSSLQSIGATSSSNSQSKPCCSHSCKKHLHSCHCSRYHRQPAHGNSPLRDMQPVSVLPKTAQK